MNARVAVVNFHALMAQFVHHVGGVGLAALIGGNHPGVGGTVLALVDGALVLHPVIFEVQFAFLRDLVHREQQRRFLDVGVVARAPFNGGQRRIRAVPFAAGGGRLQAQILVDVRAVALHFVEAAEGVVRQRDPEQIVRHPAVVDSRK